MSPENRRSNGKPVGNAAKVDFSSITSTDHLFNFPLPIPQDTLYSELGLDPEATPEEISDAKNELRARIAEERRALEKEIEAVYRQVPNLREHYNRVRDLQPGVSEGERKALLREYADFEKKALPVCPDYKKLLELMSNLEHRINELNRTGLELPERRVKYDQSRPPLSLLKLADCTRDSFTETRTALLLVRREISDFLSCRGERAFHPSDLTREDFSGDFSPHLLLDGEYDE